MGLNPERRCVQRVLQLARSPKYAGRVVAANHPWFAFLDGRDPDDRARFAPMKRATLETLPPGSLVAWDSHFSHRLSGDVPFEYFKGRPEYTLVTREMTRVPSPFLMMLFEKGSAPAAAP
jgi:hypothetical protein